MIEQELVSWEEQALFDAPVTRERAPLPALMIDAVVKVRVLAMVYPSYEAVAALDLDEFATEHHLAIAALAAVRARRPGWEVDRRELLDQVEVRVRELTADNLRYSLECDSTEVTSSWADMLDRARHPRWRDVVSDGTR